MKNFLNNVKSMYKQGTFNPYVPSEDETKAVKTFYEYLTLENNLNTIDFIDKYLAQGFKIKSEHSMILNKDPFEYLWYKIKKGNRLDQVWSKLWEQCIDEDYKNEIIKNQVVMKHTMSIIYSDNTVVHNDFSDNYIVNKEMLGFINKELINVNYLDVDFQIQTLKDYQQMRKIHSSLYISCITICTTFIDILEKKKLQLLDKKVNYNFSETIKVNNIHANEDSAVIQKNINNILKTLKLYEYKFTLVDKNEKTMFLKLIDHVEQINQTDYLAKNSEAYVYIERLVYKHMPELLGDFLELPEKIKYNFKDNNGKTPQDLFKETLLSIEGKVDSMLHEAFNDKIINIKVKNRLMKLN